MRRSGPESFRDPNLSRLVATEDHMIPPPAQRMMAKRAAATVFEVPGSHAIYVSKPKVVAKIIEQAAHGKK